MPDSARSIAVNVVSIRHARILLAILLGLAGMAEAEAWIVPPKDGNAEAKPGGGEAKPKGAKRPGVAQLDAPQADRDDPLDDPEAARREQFFGNMPGFPMPAGFPLLPMPGMPMPGMPGQGGAAVAGAFAGGQGAAVASGGTFQTFQSFGAFGTTTPDGGGVTVFQFQSNVPGVVPGPQPPAPPQAGKQGGKSPPAARQNAKPAKPQADRAKPKPPKRAKEPAKARDRAAPAGGGRSGN